MKETIGLVMDIWIEKGNDRLEYDEIATQEDLDQFQLIIVRISTKKTQAVIKAEQVHFEDIVIHCPDTFLKRFCKNILLYADIVKLGVDI